MNEFQKIIVKRGKKGLKVINTTRLELVGTGAQVAVFKLSQDRCVKI